MKNLVARLMIKMLKCLKVDLLPHAHVQHGVGHNTYVSGEEHVINRVLVSILKREPVVIVDVGANVGDYVNLLVRRFCSCTVYCFEPVLSTFMALNANVKNTCVITHNIALGEKEGTLVLYQASEDGDGSMVTAYRNTIDIIFDQVGRIDKAIECPVTTLDIFCKKNRIDEIDFLKIDVEGHELKVLKGAPELIRENRIRVIQFEFNEFNIFSKSFLWDFYDCLPQFDFYRIMPQSKLYPLGKYDSINEIFRYQNILAVNKSLNYRYA